MKLEKKFNKLPRIPEESKKKDKKDEIKINKLTEKDTDIIERCLLRMCGKKDESYYREMLTKLVENQSIDISLLEEIPRHPDIVGKTKFDQLYDAALSLAFPGYKEKTLRKLVGDVYDPDLKIWRVILPPKFGITAVLIRASSYQDAFALGCDYACRVSLRLFQKIPLDLTIRVMFVSERSVKRKLTLRKTNRDVKRNKYKLIGRVHSPKELSGVRIFALGHLRNDPRRNLANYVEEKDLTRIKELSKSYRISGVEAEIYDSDMKALRPDDEVTSDETPKERQRKVSS